MFRFCLVITLLSALGMAVGGFLTMDPPLITLKTAETAREVLITIFCIFGVGTLIFAPKNPR